MQEQKAPTSRSAADDAASYSTRLEPGGLRGWLVLVDGREWHTVDTTTTSEWWAAGSDDVGFRWRLAAIGRVAVNVVGDGGLKVHLAAEGERSS